MNWKVGSAFLVFFIASKISCQELDTIFSLGGGYIIIHSADNDEINDFEEEFGFARFRGNYREYDKNGTLLKESILVENDSISYEEIRRQGQISSTRESVLYGELPTYTTRKYYESGRLEYEQISCTEFNEERKYYDNASNSLWIYQRQKKIRLSSFKMIKYKSEKDSSFIVEQRMEKPGHVWHSYLEYHENGRLKVSGQFCQRKFIAFTSKRIYDEFAESEISVRDFERLYIDGEKLVRNIHPQVRTGKWAYFDGSGNLIEEIQYFEGRVISSK